MEIVRYDSSNEGQFFVTYLKIMADGEKVGYIDLDECEDGTVYLASIEIEKSQRGQGIGTEVLKMLVERYGEIYLCPDNERCISLYERLGEEVPCYKVPEMLTGMYDEYGKMYRIA